ncbi:MAG TPA: ABC transporter ATP-binding protein [Candidatus Thioglobus sp.]|jgi:lipoprotein-releasing system ATP-binding protein|nr:ABC transporter ATP-binding protein [Candidatus Thioglobus sp.]HIL20235.1 ABC transporter ATP-binding protein [Candidatus Thioglobus sp.]
MSNLIECHALGFSYGDDASKTQVLDNIDFSMKPGESVAILGQSGCGKSTLLNLIAGLDTPTSGEVLISNINPCSLTENARTKLRAETFGFVYQFHHLLRDFSALDNVALPLLIRGDGKKDALQRAEQLLTKIGLEHRLQHKPGELSGGERQRVAIARALVAKPACLIADEPTGNLDAYSASEALSLLLELNKERQSSLLIVTHDLAIANKMDRILTLSNLTLK